MAGYAIRWRLVYPDGRTLDERPEGSTILERPANPRHLQLITANGEAVQDVPIPAGYVPIFYRRRSLAMDGTGRPALDATVFGFGREGLDTFDGRVWLWHSEQAENCPAELMAAGTLEYLITASPEAYRMV